ncbi:TcmI family type II polyketide cyclase [Amycolatopsis japonica]
MQRVLFIDRMDPDDAGQVARIWAEHDVTGLPERIGVARRTLFRFRGLYVHMVEFREGIEDGLVDRIYSARTDPAFERTRSELSEFLQPFAADVRNLKDTEARPFYTWQA